MPPNIGDCQRRSFGRLTGIKHRSPFLVGQTAQFRLVPELVVRVNAPDGYLKVAPSLGTSTMIRSIRPIPISRNFKSSTA